MSFNPLPTTYYLLPTTYPNHPLINFTHLLSIGILAMSVDLQRLDHIKDYDQAIEALEEFVEDLVSEFVTSAEGKTYLKAHPEMEEYVGSWIDHLLYFGYAYESVTLPNMTVGNIDVIVTKIFPNKISLLDPEEANTAIPELSAFWQYLKREYKHPQAHKIIKLLKQIQPKFKHLMNDSRNFGIAKSFMMEGIAEGFDMTTQEGIEEFQQQYNQKLQGANPNPGLPNLGSFLGELSELEGDGVPSEGELQNLLQELVAEISADPSIELPPLSDLQHLVETEFAQKLAQETPGLSDKAMPLASFAIALLQEQEITATNPGKILTDFQTLLDFIGEPGIAVSGKRNLIPMKLLAELNQQLSEPIQTNLQRPQQKSYPTINGLYLLLRATGLGKIVQQGKKMKLILDSDILHQWSKMNPTERYFNLLEAWLLVANEEMLGERFSNMNEGIKCLQYWSRIPSKGQKFPDYQMQQNLRYYPEFHNLALMKLFGLVEATYGKPQKGKGWRVKSVKQTAWGKALIEAVSQGWTFPEMIWDDEEPEDIQFGKLQPVLQPYFPQWQKIIELPKIEPSTGVYVFKVSLHNIWRRIAISSELTLWDLSQLILQSVDFDSDHLDMFSYKNPLGRSVQAVHPYMDDSPTTEEVKIGELPLVEGSMMEYVFDFGDHWEFQVQLEEINRDDLRPDFGAIIASKGKAPEQYPDYDDYDE